MKTIIGLAILGFGAAICTAQQTTINLQTPTALDVFADSSRSIQSTGGAYLYSPMGVGMVASQNGVILSTTPTSYYTVSSTTGGFTYNPDIFYTAMSNSSTGSPTYASQICWNFGSSNFTMGTRVIPANSVALYSQDFIPVVETVVPKGTFTIQSAATPIGGSSTPGVFQLQTLTAGVWTVQFSDKLTAAQKDSRSLAFPYTTHVRWLLIRSGSATAAASVTCRWQQTS